MSSLPARVVSAMTLGLSLAGVSCSSAPRTEPPPADVESLGADSPLVVTTEHGKLRGMSTGLVDEFLGIRYAAPPVGKLRLASPAPPEPWDGIRDATRAGSVCPQLAASGFVGDEDCLWLNVYRPATPRAGGSLPVMVWIHGGSFKSGAGSEYDPKRLVATNDMIVVTINYRLGPLGFLAGNGLSGDYGLQDQQAALRWVRDNIAAFGGDPTQVTIQGESAGGASVCAQLTSPSASGLFSRAVIQSASCASVPFAFAESQARLVAAKLGCTASEPAACLADETLGAERIVRASEAAGAIYAVVAGSGVVPVAPFEVVAARQQSRVPVLIGGITDEMSFFAASDGALIQEVTQKSYRDVLAHWFANVNPDAILSEYPLNAYQNAFFAVTAVFNDSGLYYAQALGGCVTARVADALSTSVPTYAYELDDPHFTWVGGGVGASHMSELPYLFDLAHPFSQPLNGTQSKLADTLVRTWGAFASGNAPSADWPLYVAAPPPAELTAPGATASAPAAANTRYFNPEARAGFIELRTRHHCDFWQKACGPYGERCPYPAR